MFAVFIDQVSPRIHYVLEELLERRLQTELKIFTETSEFIKDDSPVKIQYVVKQIEGLPGFVVIQDAIMTAASINPAFNPTVSSFNLNSNSRELLLIKSKKTGVPDSEIQRIQHFLEGPFPCLFPNESELGFDVFAMAFYFLSRYEEYQAFDADSFGRFSYKESLEAKWAYDVAPHVDIAFYHFLCALNRVELIPNHSIIASFDIDIAYQFKGRSWRRQLASALRFPKLLWERLSVMSIGNDPFDPNRTVFSFIQNTGVQSRVFWLCSKRVKGVNRQVKRTYVPFNRAIKASAQISNIGLHPSFSMHPTSAWQEEKNWLEDLLGSTITHSRQHFVHLLFPDTYQRLIELGIQHEWSMGYADHVGFRAGTAFDFRWFDLSKNVQTSLTVHPFCIMDVAAKNYMSLSPFAAIDAGRSLKEKVFLFGGNFTFIAHNESLSERMGWEQWMPVFKSWANPDIHISASIGQF